MLFRSFCAANMTRASWQLVSQSTRQKIHDWQGFMKEKIEKDMIRQSNIQVIMPWTFGLILDLIHITYICWVKPYSRTRKIAARTSYATLKKSEKTQKLFSDLQSNSEKVVDSNPLLRVPWTCCNHFPALILKETVKQSQGLIKYFLNRNLIYTHH